MLLNGLDAGSHDIAVVPHGNEAERGAGAGVLNVGHRKPLEELVYDRPNTTGPLLEMRRGPVLCALASGCVHVESIGACYPKPRLSSIIPSMSGERLRGFVLVRRRSSSRHRDEDRRHRHATAAEWKSPSKAFDVVALTITEYVPRQVMRLQRLLAGMPLLD